MENNIQTTLQNNIKSDSTVILAISGGPDSIYLLFQCLKIQKYHPFKMVIAHVNHGLRGKESDLDNSFVKNLAKKNKLKFEELKLKLKKMKGNMEAIGRAKRYEFFEKLRQKYHADWILTAHQQNDNLETVLFNLIRGSSFQGLKGMQATAKEHHLLRPLLNTKKTAILHYLKTTKIPFRIDKSNHNLKFSRNLLRQKIIPLLQKINANFEQTFELNLKNFNEIANFLEEKSKTWLKNNSVNNNFALKTFLTEPAFLQKNILVEIYKKLYGSTQKLTHRQLDEILKIFAQRKSNRQKEFGPKYFIMIARHSEKTPQLVKLKQKTVKRLKKAQK